MSYSTTESVSITTDASGDGSAGTSMLFSGPVRSIIYTPDGTSPFDTGFAILVKSAVTLQTLWTESAVGTSAVVVNPRQGTHDNTRTASLFAGGGEPTEDYYFLANEAVTFTVSSGGNAKTGSFRIIAG